MSGQDVVIEQALAAVQSRLSQQGETPKLYKPDSWRFIGIDLRLSRGYTVRITPTEAGIRVDVLSPGGWPAAAPETTPGDIAPDDLADRILSLYGKAVG